MTDQDLNKRFGNVRFADLSRKIQFHDSSILEVKFDEASYSVWLKVNLCNWAQNDYRDDQPENIIIWLEFCHAFLQNYDFEVNDACDEIMRITYPSQAAIDFAIYDHVTYSSKHLTVRADEVYLRSSYHESFECTSVLDASNDYVVVKTDEEVRLIFKNQSRSSIVIGDFYGDAEAAVIDENQKFVATVGCGLIVYFLEDPFTEYQYDTKTLQWLEYGREKEQALWLRTVRQLSPDTIEALNDQGGKHRFAFSITPQQNKECTLVYPSCELQHCRTIGHYHGFGYGIQCAFVRQPIVTSYFSPIYTDEQEYTITVLKVNTNAAAAYKIISEITGKNYLALKKEMGEAPLPVFSGKAREALLCIRKLKDSDVLIRISPDFPYTDEDLWQEE